MNDSILQNKIVIVTGGGRRVGRALALASAQAGADVVIHFCHGVEAANSTRSDIEALGRHAWAVHADFSQPENARKVVDAAAKFGDLHALVNSAAIFGDYTLENTNLADWNRHFAINLTAPFILTQAFATSLSNQQNGRVINILDWRAFKPGSDHFAYTITKAALASMTRSMAFSLAPRITVNGLALGAILPPESQPAASDILAKVPSGRWGSLNEIGHALRFLLVGPEYITGQIIHIDGGRHLL